MSASMLLGKPIQVYAVDAKNPTHVDISVAAEEDVPAFQAIKKFLVKHVPNIREMTAMMESSISEWTDAWGPSVELLLLAMDKLTPRRDGEKWTLGSLATALQGVVHVDHPVPPPPSIYLIYQLWDFINNHEEKDGKWRDIQKVVDFILDNEEQPVHNKRCRLTRFQDPNLFPELLTKIALELPPGQAIFLLLRSCSNLTGMSPLAINNMLVEHKFIRHMRRAQIRDGYTSVHPIEDIQVNALRESVVAQIQEYRPTLTSHAVERLRGETTFFTWLLESMHLSLHTLNLLSLAGIEPDLVIDSIVPDSAEGFMEFMKQVIVFIFIQPFIDSEELIESPTLRWYYSAFAFFAAARVSANEYVMSRIVIMGRQGVTVSFTTEADQYVAHLTTTDATDALSAARWTKHVNRLNLTWRLAQQAEFHQLGTNLINSLSVFFLRIMLEVDDSIVLYIPQDLSRRFQVMVKSPLFGRDVPVVPNIQATSLKYGTRVKFLYDPAFPVLRASNVSEKWNQDMLPWVFL